MTTVPELLIFTDLDDSLFTTLRKIPESQRDNLHIAARAAAGKDSYMNNKQRLLLDWMDVTRCIPVTARGTEAYSRVAIPFAGPAAIVANGAVILDGNGSINTPWAEEVSNTLSQYQQLITALPQILTQLAATEAMDIRSWAVTEPSCGAVYAVAKSNSSSDGTGLESLLQRFKLYSASTASHSHVQWQYHVNGNNLSIMPDGINKAAAVRHLMTQLDVNSQCTTVGVGDSTSDLAFMQLCDVWLTPSTSQIDSYLRQALLASNLSSDMHTAQNNAEQQTPTDNNTYQSARQSQTTKP